MNINTMRDEVSALDHAVIAFRENPTDENRAALFEAMNDHNDDRLRRESHAHVRKNMG